jgi:hypothetical protein
MRVAFVGKKMDVRGVMQVLVRNFAIWVLEISPYGRDDKVTMVEMTK